MSYFVEPPQATVFSYVTNFFQMHEDLNVFENAKVTTNDLASNQIGKCYFIRSTHGDLVVETMIKLQEIKTPNFASFEYTYKTIDAHGKIKDGCSLMPWNTMTCKLNFDSIDGKTKVTNSMLAHGNMSLAGVLFTKFFAIINIFQMFKYNKRTVLFLNGNQP